MRRPRERSGDEAIAESGSPFAGATTDADAGRSASMHAWCDLVLRGVVITLATLWAYSPAYHGDWLWDDDMLLTANPIVQSGTLAGLWKLWFASEGIDYFPLSYSALWAQWLLFGPSSTGYHVVSILLHLVGSLLLWRLLASMRIPGAWLAGLVFAIHPACVESVAWVSELKNTLSLPPFLLSAICFVEHDAAAQETGDAASRRSSLWHGLALVFFLVAMLAKTSMVMFPVVLLLHAWWRRGRITSRDLLAAAPFFLVSLVLGLVTIHFQHGRAIGQEKIPVGDLFTVAGLVSRTVIAGMAIFFYLWTLIWPFQLLPIYPRWEVAPPEPWQFLLWPILVAATWWLWQERGTPHRPTWQRHTLFAFGFFVLMLLPILGFVTISYMRITWVADHFLYVPMIGPIALLAAGAARVAARVPLRHEPVFLAAGSLLLAILAVATHHYAHAFASEDALWECTLASNNDAWQAHNRLGARKYARGDVDGGLFHFENAVRLRPDLGETHNNLGTALLARGRVEEALDQFREAASLMPYIPQFQINLASALVSVGRLAEAEESLQDLTVRFPEMALAWNGLGLVRVQRGKTADAVAALRHAASLDPDSTDVKANLRAALLAEAERLAREGSSAPAERIYGELLSATPDDVQVLTNHGVTLFHLGRRDEAIAAFRRALAVDPGAKDARESLAVATGEPIPPPPPPPDEIVPSPATLAPPTILP